MKLMLLPLLLRSLPHISGKILREVGEDLMQAMNITDTTLDYSQMLHEKNAVADRNAIDDHAVMTISNDKNRYCT